MLVTEQDKHNLSEEKYKAQLKEDQQAYRESSTNVRMDEMELARLLENGPQAKTTASSSSSTAGFVRDLSEVTGSNEEASSKKRR
jgi:hypothetical protein